MFLEVSRAMIWEEGRSNSGSKKGFFAGEVAGWSLGLSDENVEGSTTVVVGAVKT